MAVGGLGYFLLMVHSANAQRSSLVLVCLVGIVLLVVAFGNLKLFTTKVQIDDTCIVVCSILSTRILRWQDIDDLVSVPRALVLCGANGRPRISLCRGDYGFSLEPFEEMKVLILRKVEPLLLEKWAGLHLKTRRAFVYPSLSLLQWGGYIAVFVYGTYLFVVGPLQYGALGWVEMLFWVATLLLIGSLLFRDYRMSRRLLVVSEEGICATGVAKTRLLRWDGIARIVVKGNGIVVEGHEPPGICVPLRMLRFGELFFFLRTRSRAEVIDA